MCQKLLLNVERCFGIFAEKLANLLVCRLALVKHGIGNIKMKVFVSESAKKGNVLDMVVAAPFHSRVSEATIEELVAGHKGLQTKVHKLLTDLNSQRSFFKDFDVAFIAVTKSALPFLLRDTSFAATIKEDAKGAVAFKIDGRFTPIVNLVAQLLNSCGYVRSEKSPLKEMAKANNSLQKLLKAVEPIAQLIRDLKSNQKTLVKATDIKKSEQAVEALTNFLKQLRTLERNWTKFNQTLTKLDEIAHSFVDTDTNKPKVDAKAKARSKRVLTNHAQTVATTELLKLLKLKHKANPEMQQISELSGVAGNASKVKEWLAKKGVTANFTGTHCSAAYMKVDMKWVVKAEKATFKDFAASLHKKVNSTEVDGVSVYYVPAKGNNTVAIYIPKNAAQMKESFIQKVVDKSKSKLDVITRGLKVPNVSLSEVSDFSKELRATIGKADVDGLVGSIGGNFQGKQVTQFDMDEVGARVVQYAFTMAKSLPRPPIVIDKPFVAVLIRKTVDIPIFAAYCDERTWKKGKK